MPQDAAAAAPSATGSCPLQCPEKKRPALEARHPMLEAYGPTVGGLSTPKAPEELFQKNPKNKLVAKKKFFLRICTIFCMREAVYIPYVSRILPAPRPLKRPQNRGLFLGIFPKRMRGGLGTMVPWCHGGAITMFQRNTHNQSEHIRFYLCLLKSETTWKIMNIS